MPEHPIVKACFFVTKVDNKGFYFVGSTVIRYELLRPEFNRCIAEEKVESMFGLFKRPVKKSRITQESRLLRLEALEDRRMLAPFSVDNILDSSTGSLRWAIDEANISPGLDTITFNLNASDMAQGIEIINGPLLITDDVQIAGPSPTNQVKVFGGVGATRGFDFKIQVGTANPSQISNLKISGFAQEAIHVERLQSSDSLLISNNTIESSGDGIEINPNGTVVRILIEDNTYRTIPAMGSTPIMVGLPIHFWTSLIIPSSVIVSQAFCMTHLMRLSTFEVIE